MRGTTAKCWVGETNTLRERSGQGHASFPAIVKVKCRQSLGKHANEMQMRRDLEHGGVVFM